MQCHYCSLEEYVTFTAGISICGQCRGWNCMLCNKVLHEEKEFFARRCLSCLEPKEEKMPLPTSNLEEIRKVIREELANWKASNDCEDDYEPSLPVVDKNPGPEVTGLSIGSGQIGFYHTAPPTPMLWSGAVCSGFLPASYYSTPVIWDGYLSQRTSSPPQGNFPDPK